LQQIRAKGSFNTKDVNKVIDGLSKNLNIPKVNSEEEASGFFGNINNDEGDFDICHKFQQICKNEQLVNPEKAFETFE